MKPTGDSLRRIIDERLAELEYHARLYNNNLALTGKDALDLIADLRDARKALNTIWEEGCCSCLGSMHDYGNELCAENIARAYFDAKARAETKREGAE